MKRLVVFFLLINIPNLCFGLDDACTNPSEYKIDRRCYVTDEQKQQNPYSATVALIDEYKDPYCTGTIIENKGKLYIVTAKHCVTSWSTIKQEITVQLQIENKQIDVYAYSLGKYYEREVKNEDGTFSYPEYNMDSDWAIYEIPEENMENLPFTHITKHNDIWTFVSDKLSGNAIGDFVSGITTKKYDARLIGYGALKIMSDKEIEKFKQDYIEYLKKHKDVTNDDLEDHWYEYGLSYDDSIYKNNGYVIAYISLFMKDDERNKIFQDKELKVSYCKYTSTGAKIGCQSWGGNSGGGIFDNDNNLMGILTRTSRYVGGDSHAGIGDDKYGVSKDSPTSINLQPLGAAKSKFK